MGDATHIPPGGARFTVGWNSGAARGSACSGGGGGDLIGAGGAVTGGGGALAPDGSGGEHWSTRKDTNPKDAVGIAKVPISTLSAQVMGEVGLAMLEGARKYGRHNYRVAGVRASVYYDAAGRHMMAWYEGQDDDPASGISHVSKAIAGLMVLRDAMMNEMMEDDRPPKVLNQDWVEEQSAQAAAIIAKYPDAKPPFTNVQ